MNQDIGKYIIVVGLGIIVLGALIYFFHDKLHWLGRLPGDIRVEREKRNGGYLFRWFCLSFICLVPDLHRQNFPPLCQLSRVTLLALNNT